MIIQTPKEKEKEVRKRFNEYTQTVRVGKFVSNGKQYVCSSKEHSRTTIPSGLRRHMTAVCLVM